MRSLNILRSIVLAIGAAYLIFSQDHSALVGIQVLQFVSISLVIGSLVMLRIPKLKLTFKVIALPTTLALVVAAMTVLFGGQYDSVAADELFVLRSLVVLFAVGMAALELILSRKAKPEDVLELRISAGLGVITGLVFCFAPLDDLNAVGFLSAYLAISSVQRAIWAAGPSNGKKSSNGKN
jgi:hypothetical protein